MGTTKLKERIEPMRMLFAGTEVVRRCLTRLCVASLTTEMLLHECGVDVDKLNRENQRRKGV